MKINKQRFNLCKFRTGKTVRELEAGGMPVGTYARILKGRELRPATVFKIAAALGVDPIYLLEDEDRRALGVEDGQH